MPIGVETTQHPKEAILHRDELLKEKLTVLEKKLLQIRNELLGVFPEGKSEETEKPPQTGFLARIEERLSENCVKVDGMNAIANEVVKSLVVESKATVVGS